MYGKQQQRELYCLGDHSQGRSGDGGHPAVKRALHQGHRQRGIPCKYQIAQVVYIMQDIMVVTDPTFWFSDPDKHYDLHIFFFLQ